jgi:rod shape-determining protein MreC
MRIEYLERKDEVVRGDEVFTTGFGAFPRDLRVGTIVNVVKRDFGLYQDVEVEPSTALSRLSDVLIVRSTADAKAEPAK